MKTKQIRRALFGIGSLMAAILLSGCAANRIPGDRMGKPEDHFRQGIREWDREDMASAQQAFNRARSLDPGYGPAYSGLALVAAARARKEASRAIAAKGFRTARTLADRGVRLSPQIPDVHVARALVMAMEHQGGGAGEWIMRVEAAFSEAIRLAPADPEAFYRRGLWFRDRLLFKEAGADFQKVRELNSRYFEQADAQLVLLRTLERASVETDAGQRISLSNAITRADAAALFILELSLDKRIAQTSAAQVVNTGSGTGGNSGVIADMRDHRARDVVERILGLDLPSFRLSADRNFYPDSVITRADFALMVEDAIIAVTGDTAIAGAHLSESASRFRDVGTDHPSYNAICTSADRGILRGRSNRTFGPDQPVSGVDAVVAIRLLKNYL